MKEFQFTTNVKQSKRILAHFSEMFARIKKRKYAFNSNSEIAIIKKTTIKVKTLLHNEDIPKIFPEDWRAFITELLNEKRYEQSTEKN